VNNVDELLGLDPNDPEDAAALEDARSYADLIDTLARLRNHRRLSLKDVAVRLEVTPQRLMEVERAGSDLTLSFVQRYARAIGARLVLAVDVDLRDTHREEGR
jgi:transcriptional regulator with XRE-family HTH domain